MELEIVFVMVCAIYIMFAKLTASDLGPQNAGRHDMESLDIDMVTAGRLSVRLESRKASVRRPYQPRLYSGDGSLSGRTE